MKIAYLMKKASKMAFLIMFLCLCVALTGCGGSSNNTSSPSPSPSPNPSPGPSPSPSPSPSPNPVIPLTSPQSLQVTGLDGKILVRWTRLAEAQGIAATYEVWVSATDNANTAGMRADGIECIGTLLCQVEIDSLTNGITYYVWVKAVYGSLGTSDFYENSFSGMPVPTPTTPTGLTVIPGENLIEVRWDAPMHAFSYEVLYRNNNPSGTAVPTPGGFFHVVSVTDPAIVITTFDGNPLANDRPYYIWVRAVNSNGSSAYTMQATGVPAEAEERPSAPGNLVVEPGNRRISLTWDNVSGATKYNIYRNTVNNSASAALHGTVPHNIPRASAMIADLTNGATYYVWVTAENSKGESDFSPVGVGTPEARNIAIDFTDFNFILGEATAEFIFAEVLPLAPFSGRSNGQVQDRLTRVKETPLGNLFTDGAAWYAREVMNEEIDFVFLHGGFIDNAISRGSISLGNLAAASRDRADTFTFFTLRGSDVIELFNEAADIVHTGAGTGGTSPWANVSREVSYTIQYEVLPSDHPSLLTPEVKFSSAEAEPYTYGYIKPGTLRINGQAVDPDRYYRIATTSSLAEGVEGYITPPVDGRDVKETTALFWHGVAEYIYENGSVTPSLPVNNAACRITLEGGVWLGALNENICNFRTHRP